VLGYLYVPDLTTALGPSGMIAPVLAVTSVIYIAPVVFFYVFAHMSMRSQELRMVAQSMAEVAMRLAEPETVARESIVTVGQAIRREVAAMGDGVERALARAAELETLVANEVSALEHAYNDNEVRIRALLQDLGGQRDTLVGQAEQIRDAINGVHLDLSSDISQISQLVAEQVNEASRRITHQLAEKGESITRSLGQTGEGMVTQLSDRGGELLERLEQASNTTSEAITQASDRLTATLNFKTDHIGDEFTEIAANLQHMMSVRLDRVADGFSQKSAAILDMMTGRTQQLTEIVVETGNQLADSIANRVEEVNASLKTTGDSLVLDLSLRGGDVVSKLEQTGNRITDIIVQRSAKVSDTFRDSAEMLANVVGSRSEQVREMLATRLQSFEEMFNHGGGELAERIARDSTTLGNLITRHLGEFDRTVKTYGGEMVERLSERTSEIATAMRDYLDNFDTRVTTKAAEVTASLDQQFVRFRDGLDGRTATLNDALGNRVLEIAKTLAEGGQEVVVSLEKRISDVTGVINVRGAKACRRIGRKDRRHRQCARHPRHGSGEQPRFTHRPVRRASARPCRGRDQGNRSPQQGGGGHPRDPHGATDDGAGDIDHRGRTRDFQSCQFKCRLDQRQHRAVERDHSHAYRRSGALDRQSGDLHIDCHRCTTRTVEPGDQDQRRRGRTLADPARLLHHHRDPFECAGCRAQHDRHVDRCEQRP